MVEVVNDIINPAGLVVFTGLISILIIIAIIVIFYVYFALALMSIAKRTNTKNPWLAFLPIANLYLMTQIAKVSWLTLFLTFIPLVNIFIMVWLYWKIAKNLNRPGWFSLLLLIPIVNLIILGIMAWGGKEKIQKEQENEKIKEKFTDPWS